MDFVKSLIDSMGEGDKRELDDIFDDAMQAGAEASKMLLTKAKTINSDSSAFKASLFLFVAAWSIVGHMFAGVGKSEDSRGKRNEVSRLWHLIRIAFTTNGFDRTMQRLRTFEKDWAGGKFDEIH